MCTYVNGIENGGYTNTYQKYFSLQSDIDLGSHYWDISCAFHGYLNGNNHTISNVYINSTSSESGFVGLFTTITGYDYGSMFISTIKDLILDTVDISKTYVSGTDRIGCLCGGFTSHHTTITNITIKNSSINVSIPTSTTAITLTDIGIIAGSSLSRTLENIDIGNCSITYTNLCPNDNHYANIGLFSGSTYAHSASLSPTNVNIINSSIDVTIQDHTVYVGGFIGSHTANSGFEASYISIDATVSLTKQVSTDDRIYCGAFLGSFDSVRASTSSVDLCKFNHIYINQFNVNSHAYTNNTIHTLVGIMEKYSDSDSSIDSKTNIHFNTNNTNVSYESNTGISGFDDGTSSTNYYCQDFSVLWGTRYVDSDLNQVTYGYVLSSSQSSLGGIKLGRNSSDKVCIMTDYITKNKPEFIWYTYTILDNGFFSDISLYDSTISYLLLYSPYGICKIPQPSKYGYTSPVFMLKVGSDVVLSTLSAGDSIDLTTCGDPYESTMAIIPTGEYSDADKIIKYKDADSTTVDVESLMYKNPDDSVLVPLTQYKHKTTSGELV